MVYLWNYKYWMVRMVYGVLYMIENLLSIQFMYHFLCLYISISWICIDNAFPYQILIFLVIEFWFISFKWINFLSWSTMWIVFQVFKAEEHLLKSHFFKVSMKMIKRPGRAGSPALRSVAKVPRVVSLVPRIDFPSLTENLQSTKKKFQMRKIIFFKCFFGKIPSVCTSKKFLDMHMDLQK